MTSGLLLSAENTVIVIPCAGEPQAAQAINAALAQGELHRVVLAGKRPEGLQAQERLTIYDTAAAVPPGMARNLGVKCAGHADVYIFLDADCAPHPGWLDAILARMNEGYDLVGGVIRPEGRGYFFMADQTTSFFDQLENTKGGRIPTLTATNLAVTRTMWDKAGPFPEASMAGEDLEFVMRCRREGAQPWLESAACVTHRPGPIGFRRMWRHAGHWGKDSIHVRKKYPDLLLTPKWMMNPIVLAIAAPAVGAVFAFHQLMRTPHPYRRLRLWPAITIAKTVWCLAAAKSLWLAKSD
jgi:glycosyltransferase involved in cell wall biosynthesis